MTSIVRDALIRHYGSLKAAAITMGNMDQGQLTRELQAGSFKFDRLEKLDDHGKAAVSNALSQTFGQPGNANAYARQLLREARAKLDEVDQYLEHVG